MAKIRELQRGNYEKSVTELYEDFQLQNRVKNLSEITIRFYEQNLIHFLRYLEEVGIEQASEIKKKLVDKFILVLKKKELKATTIKYILVSRRFKRLEYNTKLQLLNS